MFSDAFMDRREISRRQQLQHLLKCYRKPEDVMTLYNLNFRTRECQYTLLAVLELVDLAWPALISNTTSCCTVIGCRLRQRKAPGSVERNLLYSATTMLEAEYETDDENRVTDSAMQVRIAETDAPEFCIFPIQHVAGHDIDINPNLSDQKRAQLITLVNRHRDRLAKELKELD
ncbi:hypothetical protein BGZ50_007251 [Haplosporangium sp. Z 11]|nr:hypothetical protein BGZ50_007251 [Haplosporangium sp. Z 11]